jgi:GntR family transcriptional regulator, transcriptional repressor for pyruvate dehydrogenase complex
MEAAQTRVPKRSLTQKVIEGLRAKIEGGDLPVGAKLPTEVGLIEEFGVSRTVIREAIAGLKADGLVEPRHGVGVFVTAPPASNVSTLFAIDTERLSSIIEALELRAAVEIEAAGLAAERRSPAQMAKIQEAFQLISKAVEAGDSAEKADFDFHMAIAEAANNGNFCEFLNYLGRRTIPRARLRGDGGDNSSNEHYLRKIHNEHLQIAEAISERSPEAAREAMRIHLKGSQDRYGRLMQAS